MMKLDTTPPAATPPPRDWIDRLRGRAQAAALLSALLSVALAFLIAALYRDRWLDQGDYDYGYANSGFGAYATAWAMAGLYLVLTWVLRRARDPFAAGAALTVGWAMRVLLVLLFVRSCAPVTYGVSAMALFLRDTPVVPVAAVLLLLAQTPLVRYARAAGAAGEHGRRAMWTGRLAPCVYAVLCTTAYLGAQREHRGYRGEDGVRAVWRLHACAHRYAERHPELGFPASDREMARAGSGCGAAGIAGHRRFVPSYRAAPRDARGRVSSYVVQARQRHLWGQRYESLVANEAGLVHIAYGRAATLRDHIAPIGGLSLQAYSGCLDHFHWEHGQRGYPTDLTVIQTEMRCATVGPLVAPNVVERHGYRITYEPAGVSPAGADSLARGYTLHARPITYGETGVRSYFVGARGVVTATADDRAATASDTPVLACEFDPMMPWRECIQGPDDA